MSENSIIEDSKKRFADLEREGKQWYGAWQDLVKYLNPTRGYFYDAKPNRGQTIDHTTLIDSHARRAIRDSASGMLSGFTSPSRPWFKIETPDPDLNKYAPVKLQLDEIGRRMMTIFSTSNSYDMHYNVYEEILSFGTACGEVLEDYQDVIRCYSYTIGEYFLGFDSTGRLNAFSRKIWKTVKQMVDEFGLENVSQNVQNNYGSKKFDQWHQVCHLIEINNDRQVGYIDNINMLYRSVYWESGANIDKPLRIGGFEENPILGPRWQTTTCSDSYGKSPGWDLLGDNKMLQKEQKDKLLAIEKVGNPPMQADSSIDDEINTLPGGITRTSATTPNAGLRPAYQVNPDINALKEDVNEVKAAISDALYSNLFKMMIELDRGNITATEIAERQAEKLSMLAPFTEKLNNEYLNPFVNRCFGIMLRNGLFPDFPPEMQGIDLRVKYISLMAQAQKMVGISALDGAVAFAGRAAELNENALDNINFDEHIRSYYDMAGVDAKNLNSPEMVEKIRKQKQEELEAQRQAQQVALMAESAAKGGKALKDASDAPLNQGSALDGIMDTVKDLNQ